jgi:hypothetical protein
MEPVDLTVDDSDDEWGAQKHEEPEPETPVKELVQQEISAAVEQEEPKKKKVVKKKVASAE